MALLRSHMLPERLEQSGYNRRKRRADSDHDSLCSGDAPPEFKRRRTQFWDTLSKVRLSQRALREFDRRKGTGTDIQQEHCERLRPCPEAFIFHDIKQFARRGGPLLAHLRGYAESVTMPRSSAQGRKRSAASGRSDSTKVTKSTPYSPNYEQKLIDIGIYPTHADHEGQDPANTDEILARLKDDRASLSPPRSNEEDFKHFRRDLDRAKTETSTMQIVTSALGGDGHGHRSAADLLFTCTKPMAEDLAQAKPDLYDGIAPGCIDVKVRTALQDQILPSTQPHMPAAPNFFVEGKSPRGRADVAVLQACHDGAIGARAMHALQNYGEDIPTYDGKAYSFSCTYHDGQLKMFSHHLTVPKFPRTNPEYCMTQLKGFCMTSDLETFQKGASAYRNLRDYAKEQRELFVSRANERASILPASTPFSMLTSTQTVPTTTTVDESDTSTDELSRDEVFNKRMRSSSQTGGRRVRPKRPGERLM